MDYIEREVSDILSLHGSRQKKTSENCRFSEVFFGLIDPTVIHVEPLSSDIV